MKALLSTVCAATIAASAVMPLQAAPLHVPQVASPASVELVQVPPNRAQIELRQARRWDRDGRRWDRDWSRHRHWRHRRHRDWDDDDVAIGLGAFAAGALLGGVLNSGPRVVYRSRYNSAHVEWCYDRYRSYRASDNTFQPYHGPRRQCYSPYS